MATDGQPAASSSASATASSQGPLRVSVGTFIVEEGARLALEIVREEPCTCLCEPILVSELALLDLAGETVRHESFDPAIDSTVWIGRLPLVDEEGSALAGEPFSVIITTSAGEFTAEVQIATSQEFAGFGRFSVSASVCGLELRLYRLVTEEDHGASLALRRGDRLLVALAGNATTGFEWSNAITYEFVFLRETDESEYRPDVHPDGMVGTGGTYLFRYEAIDIGPQAFRFVYMRPWESVQPAQVVEFDVVVY
jgi:predicted secreted protein